MGRAERERRKAAQQEKFEATKAALLARIVPESVPKAAEQPQADKQVRLAPHLQRKTDQEPKEPKTEGSRFGLPVTWCISKKDVDGSWTWDGGERQWTEQEWAEVIDPGFKEFNGRTWADIDGLASGTGHKMHHGQDICDLHQEAHPPLVRRRDRSTIEHALAANGRSLVQNARRRSRVQEASAERRAACRRLKLRLGAPAVQGEKRRAAWIRNSEGPRLSAQACCYCPCPRRPLERVPIAAVTAGFLRASHAGQRPNPSRLRVE